MTDNTDLHLLLGFLPDLKGKAGLQLGSKETFTKILSDLQLKSLVVLDTNEDNLAKNQLANSTCLNIVYSTKNYEVDSSQLRFDLIFSDSNFIGFSDERIQRAVEKSMGVMNPNGLLLVRESFDTLMSKIFEI